MSDVAMLAYVVLRKAAGSLWESRRYEHLEEALEAYNQDALAMKLFNLRTGAQILP